MRKLILTVLVILIALTACDYVPVTPGSPNPYSDIADGQATQAAAQAVLQATQDIIDNQNYQATQRSLETEGALQVQLDLMNAQATGTMQTYQIESARAQATEAARRVMVQETETAQNAQSTATVQAAIVTSTAQAALLQTQAAYPAQATSTQAAVNLIARADREAEVKAKWAELLIPVKALFWPAFWLTVLVLFVAGFFFAYRRLMPVLEMRLRTVNRKGDENPLVILDHMLIDAARMFGPALLIGPGGAHVTGAVQPEYQARVTGHAQLVDAMRALPRDGSGRQAAKQVLQKAMPQPAESPEAEIITAQLPPIAPWRMLDDWSGGALPLGLTSGGMLMADPELQPHLLFAGTTGSGKTRYGLRPALAGALVSGWQVVVLDRSGLDFLPFEQHPNCSLVTLDRPEDAIGYLAAFFANIQKRLRLLRDNQVSTWGRLPGAEPRQLIVMDEFSNLADSLDNAGRDELWRQARMIAAEGRKAGAHMALALQDPTAKSIDLRIRRNMTPVSYRVRDDSASRVILNAGGAESLAKQQFLTMVGVDLVKGVAFSPDDSDLRSFLDAHPVVHYPAPAWLTIQEQPQNQGMDEQTERIKTLHAAGMSLNQIQDEVFKYRGGAAYAAVRAATR